jgi:hypothetical protein
MSKEVTVLNMEEFKKLPKETQKIITSLSEDFGVKQLNVFNPLVEAMVTMEGFSTIKYEPENKESISQYKEAKKYSGNFNATTRKTKKELKAPLLATGKKLDAIEKVFLERSKDIMEIVNSEFQSYLDEKEEKAKIASDKKNAAAINKINELSEETVAQNLVIARNKAFTSYQASNQEMLDSVIERVDNWSANALTVELDAIDVRELVILEADSNILLDDQIENLNVSFNKMKETCVRMIKMRLTEIENEKKASEPIKEEEAIAPIPPTFNVPSIEDPQSFGKSFTEIMNKAVADINLLPTITEKEAEAKKSVTAGLNGYTLKILNYIGDGEEDN